MENKYSKNARTLSIYNRLCEGRLINKAAEANRFGVDERSIQRDIDDIRAFLQDQSVERTADSREIVYDRSQKGFRMIGIEGSAMTEREIFAVSKVMIESRAFSKKDMEVLLKKLVDGCVPYYNRKKMSDLIAGEMYHYAELPHPSWYQDMLWKLEEAVQNGDLLEIRYGESEEFKLPYNGSRDKKQ